MAEPSQADQKTDAPDSKTNGSVQKNLRSDLKSWRDLKETGKTASSDVHYFEFTIDNGSRAHLTVVDISKHEINIAPIVNTPGCPTSAAAAETGAIVAVNGGYFNLSNGLSTSYIVSAGKVLCDPRTNPALMGNPKLTPFMPSILNRTELRILHDKHGKTSLQIAPHNAAPIEGCTIFDALQAGPRLLPQITEQEESFVRKESDGTAVDSIGAHRLAARTAFGITADKHAMILCIAGSKQNEFSSGATLAEVAALLKRLGCGEAMNFDGGTSTTMVVAFEKESAPRMVCGREPETRVKSVLAVSSRKSRDD